MTDTSTIETLPAARAFTFLGGQVGVLIIHGYGGSIGDYRSIAEQLHQTGLTVRGLCLPGHGRTLEALRRATLTEWQATVYHEAMELRRHCRHVVVLGSSFGGVLALNLAALAPASCDGVVVVNAALRYRGGGPFQTLLLRLLRLVTPYYRKSGLSDTERQQADAVGSMPAWPINGILDTSRFARRVVRPELGRITTPLLIITSANDPVVGEQNGAIIADAVQSKRKRTFTLTTGGHRPFRDRASTATIVQQIQSFIQQDVAKPV